MWYFLIDWESTWWILDLVLVLVIGVEQTILQNFKGVNRKLDKLDQVDEISKGLGNLGRIERDKRWNCVFT
jgi:hypothetical protein